MELSNPTDTIRVYGGKPLHKIDADEVRIAASRITETANQLTLAGSACRSAVGQLEFAATRWKADAAALSVSASSLAITLMNMAAPAKVSSSNLGTPICLAQETEQRRYELSTEIAKQKAQSSELISKATRARTIAANISPIAAQFEMLAKTCLTKRDALLKAAGLYEETESRTQKLISQIVTYQTMATVAWSIKNPVMALANTLLAAPTIIGASLLADKLSNGQTSKNFVTGIVGGIAPYSDELVNGLANGIAAAAPNLAGHEVSLTAGISVLSTLGQLALNPGKLQVTETIPGGLCGPKVLEYQDTPSGNVLNALTRVGDLHPFDPDVPPATTYPEMGRGGLPNGTIGVEKVTHQDGSITWTVLIPGTQNFKPGVHPFDGLTDLDLMAHRQSQVNEQVLEALRQVGAKKDEPIVLIGHSLGGIAAMSIASSVIFNNQYTVGGVITAGSPTATFTGPPYAVPILHLENDEEVVSNLDGKSGGGNPKSDNRVTVTRRLSASEAEQDQKAAAGLEGAHPIETHQRTLELALETENEQVKEITERLNNLLTGESAQTKYFTARRG